MNGREESIKTSRACNKREHGIAPESSGALLGRRNQKCKDTIATLNRKIE